MADPDTVFSELKSLIEACQSIGSIDSVDGEMVQRVTEHTASGETEHRRTTIKALRSLPFKDRRIPTADDVRLDRLCVTATIPEDSDDGAAHAQETLDRINAGHGDASLEWVTSFHGPKDKPPNGFTLTLTIPSGWQ